MYIYIKKKVLKYLLYAFLAGKILIVHLEQILISSWRFCRL